MTVAKFPYIESNRFDHAIKPSLAATSTSVKTYSLDSISWRFAKPSSQGEKSNPKVIAENPDGFTVITERTKGGSHNIMLLSESKVKLVDIEHNVSTLSKVKIAYVKQEADRFTSQTIPPTSPVYPLQSLRTGWDGYWAEPLSKKVLLRAHELWMQIKQITRDEGDLPSISPAANGSVAFTWSSQYPRKELEIWLYDQLDYYAEWLLSERGSAEEYSSADTPPEGNDVEGDTQSPAELLKVISQYQES